MLKDFLNQELEYSLKTGRKMRRIRDRRCMDLKYVADACGVTEMAIRNYEQGARQLNEERLQSVADALQVDPAAIKEHNIDTLNDVVHVLFDLERAGLVAPMYFQGDDQYGVYTRDTFLCDVIQQWMTKKMDCGTGQISEEDYENWKDAFPSEYKGYIDEEKFLNPFGEEFNGDDDVIPDYCYYSLVMMMRIKQLLDHQKGMMDAYMDSVAPDEIRQIYQGQQRELHYLLDTEIRKLVKDAKVRVPAPPKQQNESDKQDNT